MAKDAANDLSFFMVVDEACKDHLAALRQWNNLKLAFYDAHIWIKDLNYAQVNSPEVQSIPYKKIFYTRNGKLFLFNSQLPDCNVPSVLWTPIDRALPVTLPSFNHNYFGLTEKIAIGMVQSDRETEATAMITTLDILHRYIETAPAIRLQKIAWALLNNDKVFLMGKPLLPIDGAALWQRGDFILPAGYDIDLYSLSEPINDALNPGGACVVIWNIDATYFLIDKADLTDLSLSSFRKSLEMLPGSTLQGDGA